MVDTLDRMAKQKKEPTETVRMPERLAYRVSRVAIHRKKSVPDYLAEVLGPIIDQHEAKMIDELANERKRGK